VTARSRRSVAAAALPGLAALALAAASGFVAGRLYPFQMLRRSLESAPDYFAWRIGAPSPVPRYESTVALVAGKMFVFGGYYTTKIEASSRVDVYDPAANTWSRKGDMPKPFTHANAVLVDGTVWFAGGFLGKSPGPATAEVWRYDPALDRWAPGPPLPEPRGGGALMLLDDALHYVGGYLPDRNTGSLDHWVLRLSDTARSSPWTRAAPLPVPRGHIAGVALAGRLYVIGGTIRHDPYPLDVALVHRYDPATDRWNEVASLPFPLSHTEPGTFVRDGRIIVVGGRSRPDRHDTMRSVLEYSPGEDRWRALPPLPAGRFAPFARVVGDDLIVGTGATGTHTPQAGPLWIGNWAGRWQLGDSMPVPLGEVAGGVIGNQLYLVGQGDRATLALDLASGLWAHADRHPARISPGHHSAAEVVNGKLYLLGGISWSNGPVVQIFDPVTDSWSLGPPMLFPTGSAASAVIGGAIYLAGGIVGDTTTRQAARLDPVSGVWTRIAPMPRARNHAAAGTDGRLLYVFGGRGPGSGDSNIVANGFSDVQIYDPATDSWTASGSGPGGPAPLPEGRGGMGKAVFHNGEFYIMGGETVDGAGATRKHVYTRVDIYDPRANRWRAGPPLPTGRHGIFPLVVDGVIYVAGGAAKAGPERTALMEILRLPREGPRGPPPR
jgi:N-acetylneuraminic acid mutarotase